MSGRTWLDSWNNIIRNVIFKDDELKTLMKLPQNTTIINFIDRYFIRAYYTTKTLKDESVRIIYGDVLAHQTNNPYVTRNELSFDIYVRQQDQRNATKDRLMLRSHLIADRLAHLLTKERILQNYRFREMSQLDMGTSTIGYVRYNITFTYLRVL